MATGSDNGTGHLRRNIEGHVKKDKDATRQSQLSYNPDGSVSNWDYNPEFARESLCRLIAAQDLSLGFGETPAFAKFIKTAHNPKFTPVSRQTTSRDLIKYYNAGREKMKDMFTTCTFSVSLTSDIWSGRAKEDYISVQLIM